MDRPPTSLGQSAYKALRLWLSGALTAAEPPSPQSRCAPSAELDILRHGTRALAMATVVECEVEFLALYQNQPLFNERAPRLGRIGPWH